MQQMVTMDTTIVTMDTIMIVLLFPVFTPALNLFVNVRESGELVISSMVESVTVVHLSSVK